MIRTAPNASVRKCEQAALGAKFTGRQPQLRPGAIIALKGGLEKFDTVGKEYKKFRRNRKSRVPLLTASHNEPFAAK